MPAPVHRTASPGGLQRAALTVSSAGDASEREAVATAARVVRMPDPAPAARSAWRSPHVARFSGAVGCAVSRPSGPTATAGTRVTAEVAAGISGGMSGGGPLPDGVRRYMEPRFQADFGRVRIHTDAPAAALSWRLNARAFTVGQHVFFGRDAFRPDHDDGRTLIAHELTHTIQQGAVVQRSPESAVGERTDMHVQRLGIDDALAYFARHAELIPGFRLLTLVLGLNPISMSRVERSAANLLRALVELLPGGALIVQALDGYRLFDRAGTWAEGQLRAVGTSGGQLKDAIGRFLDSLSWRDIFDLAGVWGRAKRIIGEPIERITGLARGMVVGILDFIREAVLRPLAGLVEGTAGYALLKGVLGYDPVTGDTVPRDPATLIGGFMRLIGQEEIWRNIQRTNALPRAWAWFRGALGALLGFVRQIPALFVRAFAQLQIADLVQVPRAFARVVSVFADFVGGFARWAGEAMWTLLEILFDAVAPGVMPYLRRAAGALRTILRQPIAFVGNLVRAGKLGFTQFAANIGAHLRTSLLGWLAGALGGTGIYLPRSFHLREIVRLVLSVLGLTWQQLRPRLARAIGDMPLRVLEESFDVVMTLRRDGPAAAWEQIAEHLSNLREMVVGQITTFVTETIVRRAALQLVALLTPAGAVIQAIVATYNTIMFFIERLRQIAQIAATFIDSIAAIAAGVIAVAANRVEQTLGGVLTLAIRFLARFLGLGRVGDAITALIRRLRAPIDRALDKVIAWIVTTARRLGRLAVATGQRLVAWWRTRKRISAAGETHELFFRGERTNAELMIASSPMPIEEFIRSKQAASAGDLRLQTAIRNISAELPGIKRVMREAAGREDEAAQKAVEDALNRLAPLIVALLGTDEWGTEPNPAPLEYEKRRAEAYPTFYLTREPEQRERRQAALRDEYQRTGEDGPVRRYTPTGEPRPAPNGQGMFGLQAASRIDVGKRIEFVERGTRGNRVGEFKELVIRHGFRPSNEGLDVDHVVELQIGGQDVFGNLWPLPAGENRSSGATIKNARTEPPGWTPMTLKEAQAHQRKRAGRRSTALWLIVTRTRQR
ncbi:MAG: DUF4157 domain-containing protein [bacterium]